MISEKQLLANRQNALHSTGPRTAEGKAVASQNAVRHGLRAETTVIPGENAEEFDRFRQLLLDDLAPLGAMEVFLADRIVAAFWKLQRAGRIETEILDDIIRQLFRQRKQDLIPEGGPCFGDAVPGDLPAKGAFATYEQAVAAWNQTPDGLACQAGSIDEASAQASFLTYVRLENKGCIYSETDTVDVQAAFAQLIEKCEHDSRLYTLISEIIRTFDSLKAIPLSRFSIPAARQFIEALGHQIQAANIDDDSLMTRTAQAIMDLRQLENAIENRLCPNLGQAVSSDCTGSNILARFQRYEGHIERCLYKALTELQKLQLLRSKTWIDPPDVSKV